MENEFHGAYRIHLTGAGKGAFKVGQSKVNDDTGRIYGEAHPGETGLDRRASSRRYLLGQCIAENFTDYIAAATKSQMN
jgi:hypothetical protein